MPVTPESSDAVDYSALAWGVGLVALAAVAGLIAHAVIMAVARRLAERFGGRTAQSLVGRADAPMRALMPIIAMQFVLPALGLPSRAAPLARQVLAIAIVAGITWLLVALLRAADDAVAVRFPVDVPDNRRARRVHTLVRIMRQTATVIVVTIGAAVALMTFPQARELGASVLASAGIAGIVIGMAARPALANLIAGVQIALTEPIAIDDVVIVQGEFGRVEEITTTYVVVRVWDLRRIIVPLSHFIEQPFQNWTRVTADLLGTVFIHTDFGVPVSAVRAELTRVLQSEPKWDGKVNVVHVTDAVSGRLELRLLMSAGNAPDLWDLRCAVRERMVDFLFRRYPESMERTRVEVVSAAGEGRLPDGPAGPGDAGPGDRRAAGPLAA